MNDRPEGANDLLRFIAASVESIRDQMATKTDLDQMATKADLARLDASIDRLEERLVAETTAIRGDIEQVHLRLDSIERALSARLSQIEADVSRLRSVIYLLVKDRPELLRLLEPPPT
jgi:hypothetical protein